MTGDDPKSRLAVVLRAAVAIAMIAMVLYFLISPLVELPETEMRGILIAALLFCLLAVRLLAADGTMLVRLAGARADSLDDASPGQFSPLSQLRC